jgi:hypothetical protein
MLLRMSGSKLMPRSYYCLKAMDAANPARQLRIPASDHKVDLGAGRGSHHIADRVERHQQISDPFETQQKNAPWLRSRTRPPEAEQGSGHRKRGVGCADDGAIAPVVDLKVVEHHLPAILPARDRPSRPDRGHRRSQ